MVTARLTAGLTVVRARDFLHSWCSEKSWLALKVIQQVLRRSLRVRRFASMFPAAVMRSRHSVPVVAVPAAALVVVAEFAAVIVIALWHCRYGYHPNLADEWVRVAAVGPPGVVPHASVWARLASWRAAVPRLETGFGSVSAQGLQNHLQSC